MKNCVAIMFAVVAIVAVSLNNFALATTPEEQHQPSWVALNTLFDELPEETHQAALENYRAKRATCDLVSGLGVGSSLCAAHCLAKRYRGGYCNSKKVCVCRK